MNKVCVITATRAEYGLLHRVIQKIQQDEELTLQLIVTGTHLEERFGYTVQEIHSDGFIPDAIVPVFCGDSSAGIIDSMALCMRGVGDALARLHPDIVILLGDRYELLAISSACLIHKIPIAHISGGEISEGAYDEYVRHAITKLSFLHFTSTEEYRQRVIQLGEHPERVFNVGDLGIENIDKVERISKEDLESFLAMPISDQLFIVTFHPVTMESDSTQQVVQLLEALDERNQFQLIFTLPNADNDSGEIREQIVNFVKSHPKRARAYPSLGVRRYLSLMSYCLGVIGNSSSGIIEAPSFHVGTINIGQRQQGRIRAQSVIDCQPTKADVLRAIDDLVNKSGRDEFKETINPYESFNTSGKIVAKIKVFLQSKSDLKKIFYKTLEANR
jgi:GDP/UDP-N,N'-diacetylbacillosamine 2-epimerase (hydrolysing)